MKIFFLTNQKLVVVYLGKDCDRFGQIERRAGR